MSRTVLISGGGVGGLAAAWWLARLGWRATVVERAPALRSKGYMIGLSGPGYEVARKMGLMPALLERHRPIAENVYLGRDGKVLWRARYQELLGDIQWITLARTELVELLYDALGEGVEVRFGTSVAQVSGDAEGVEATLSDGSRLRADLLIGADGIHSALRREVFGPDESYLRPLGYRCAAFQVADSLGLKDDFQSYAEPGRVSEFYTLAEGWLATLEVPTVVVAHGGVGRVLRVHLLGLDPDATVIEDFPHDRVFLWRDGQGSWL